jgi:hypothetical protein
VSRAPLRLLARWAPLVAPAAYAAFVLAVQPPDRAGAPDWAPARDNTLAYDDWDFVAFFLRGLNDAEGRVPGAEPPPVLGVKAFGAALRADPPLKERYHTEYPHGAMLLFRLPVTPPPPDVPHAVLDASQPDFFYYTPRNDRERWVWWVFRQSVRFYILVMAGCYVGLVLVLRAGYLPGGGLSSSGLLLVLPSALYFTLFRYDVVPALLTTLSLACLGRRRHLASGACLGLAAMLKVYPVVLAPLVARYLLAGEAEANSPPRQRLRALAGWCAAFAAAVAVIALPPLLRTGWQAFWAPYHYQLNREPFLWTAYGYLLPPGWAQPDSAAGKAFRLGVLVLTTLLLCRRAPAGLPGLLRRGAVLLIVLEFLTVFYSPQRVLWLSPLLLPLATAERRLAWLVVGLDLVTFWTWPCSAPVPHWHDVMTYARFAILAGMMGVVLVRERAETRRASPAAKWA